MRVTEFVLKDVRCFADEQTLRLRPLTFLVGENSTGKSTVLGCLHVLAKTARQMHRPPNFNEPPYQMGSFRDIVRRRRPLNDNFELGMTLQDSKSRLKYHYRVTLSERQGGTEPLVTRQSWRFPNGRIECEHQNHKSDKRLEDMEVTKKDSENGPVFNIKFSAGIRGFNLFDWFYFTKAEPESAGGDLHKFLKNAFPRSRANFFRTIEKTTMSIAPLRSKPQRTYDPMAEIPDPAGADIPFRLMNMARNRKKSWGSLRSALIDFGRASGMFGDIQMRQFGKPGSDPFQLEVKAQGPKVNLIDVGYGVSQILPILVNILESSRRMLLIQQPEVHLHPRAQAALASLLVKRLAESAHGDQGFVIETHSDYMIDRARIEIRRGTIGPDDVSLVYLDQTRNNGVRVHNIAFDGMGNMKGAPPGYRKFFLRETDRMLGFED